MEADKRVYADPGLSCMIQNVENEPDLPIQIAVNNSLPGGVMFLLPNSNAHNLSAREIIQQEGTIMVRISDLRDPNDPQGRSRREVNAAKTHKYPVGALVEYNHGVRLWVVHHARDCDQTPLYCLSADPTDTEIEREGFYNATWVKGIAEQYLTFIRMANAPPEKSL